MNTTPDHRFYVYALGFLSGRSGGNPDAYVLAQWPDLWKAGYEAGARDGVSHRQINGKGDVPTARHIRCFKVCHLAADAVRVSISTGPHPAVPLEPGDLDVMKRVMEGPRLIAQKPGRDDDVRMPVAT